MPIVDSSIIAEWKRAKRQFFFTELLDMSRLAFDRLKGPIKRMMRRSYDCVVEVLVLCGCYKITIMP